MNTLVNSVYTAGHGLRPSGRKNDNVYRRDRTKIHLHAESTSAGHIALAHRRRRGWKQIRTSVGAEALVRVFSCSESESTILMFCGTSQESVVWYGSPQKKRGHVKGY